MSSKEYVKTSIENVEKRIKGGRYQLDNKAVTSMKSGCAPELDESPELNSDDITLFQECIGKLRWAIKIDRVDILTEVSMLSSFQASPREGHLEQVLHIFAYLKKKPKLTLYFDPSEPKLEPSMFTGEEPKNFLEQIRDAEDELPPRMPISRGRKLMNTAFIDASHAANKVTRRPNTGFIYF